MANSLYTMHVPRYVIRARAMRNALHQRNEIRYTTLNNAHQRNPAFGLSSNLEEITIVDRNSRKEKKEGTQKETGQAKGVQKVKEGIGNALRMAESKPETTTTARIREDELVRESGVSQMRK